MSLPRVLLLDDSTQVHDRVRRAFQRSPVSLEVTDSLVVAQRQVLSQEPPDLLLLDLQMPTLGGAVIGRSFKRRVPLRIVIFSSETSERLREMQDYVGAEASVSKSVPDADLVDTVLSVLKAPPLPGKGAP